MFNWSSRSLFIWVIKVFMFKHPHIQLLQQHCCHKHEWRESILHRIVYIQTVPEKGKMRKLLLRCLFERFNLQTNLESPCQCKCLLGRVTNAAASKSHCKKSSLTYSWCISQFCVVTTIDKLEITRRISNHYLTLEVRVQN